MIKVTDKQYWMHPTLIPNLNTLCYNLQRDWQFAIIISGDSKVRIGKSMLGQQIGYYVAYKLNRPFTLDNVYFSGESLRKDALKSRGGVFVLDESRTDLAAPKTLREETQEIIDFFNVSGMLNHFIILILPDFFDLTKTLAIGHTKYLINCFVQENVVRSNFGEVLKYDRGFYDFYGETKKKQLYLYGKKEHNYQATSHNFWGEFKKFWIFDEEEYNKRKFSFIMSHEKKEPKLKGKIARWVATKNSLIHYMNKTLGFSQNKIIQILKSYGINESQQNISFIVTNNKIQNTNILYHNGYE